ncbi:MAG: exo-alpha-sialidase [Pirellulales bacterium]|nr:exo-alpha-sialidase [Pirellulales bacterium]
MALHSIYRADDRRRRCGLLGLAVAALFAFVCPWAAAQELNQQILFQGGSGGYYTYRIPALVVSNSGTLMAFAEGRYETLNDRATSDLILRRSFDNGQTWQNTQVVVPGFATQSNYNNPTPIVDRVTGEIIMPFILDASRVFVTKSSDDGANWSAPVEITSQVKDPGWGWYAPGPGHAIQLDSGRLLVQAYHRPGVSGTPYAHSFYSDDHGATWQLGETIGQFNLGEGTSVQTMDGNVTAIMRYDWGASSIRNTARSTDGGETWSDAQYEADLGGVNVEGSSIRYTDEVNDDANRILFSTPYGTTTREKMTVLTSYDETDSWTNPRTVYWGRSAYSDLAVSPDKSVNLLYERGRYNVPGFEHTYQSIAFAQFDQQWLEGGQDDFVRYDFAEQSSGAAAHNVDGNILDSSGVDMHGSAYELPTYVPGAPGGDGRALHFSASDDRVVIEKEDASLFFDFYDSFSIEAMFRTTSHGTGGFSGGGVIIGSGKADLSGSYWVLQVDNGQLRFVLRDVANRTRTLLAGEGLSDGEWYKVNAVRDANEHLLKLYINDQLTTFRDDDLSFLFNDEDIIIGEWSNLARSFVGDLDYVKITRGGYAPIAVPEPSSYVLLATGVITLGVVQRRRRRRA